MKKIILTTIFICYVLMTYGQANTRISGTVKNAKDSQLNVEISIIGFQEKETHQIKTKTGKFEFKF